jgi:hypothetical protein
MICILALLSASFLPQAGDEMQVDSSEQVLSQIFLLFLV